MGVCWILAHQFMGVCWILAHRFMGVCWNSGSLRVVMIPRKHCYNRRGCRSRHGELGTQEQTAWNPMIGQLLPVIWLAAVDIIHDHLYRLHF